MKSLRIYFGSQKWLPVILWMGLIFFLSAQPKLPGPDNPLWDILLKKSGHFTVYGILAWLSLRALDENELSLRRLSNAWAITALYAASDEFHQHFVPGRHATLRDWVIDIIGASFALWWAKRAQESAPAESKAQ